MIELLMFSIIPFLATLIYGAALPAVGCSLFVRNELMLTLALPSVAGAALALGIAIGFSHYSSFAALYALMALFVIATSMIVNIKGLPPVRRQLMLAGLFAGSQAVMGISMAFSPSCHSHMSHLLNGEILALNGTDLVVAGVAVAILTILSVKYKLRIFAYLLDEEGLRVSQRRGVVALYFRIATALLISMSVMQLGPLLSIAFLVLPASFSDIGKSGMTRFIGVASAVGTVSAITGFYLSIRFDLPPAYTSAIGVIPIGLGTKIISKLIYPFRRCLLI